MTAGTSSASYGRGDIVPVVALHEHLAPIALACSSCAATIPKDAPFWVRWTPGLASDADEALCGPCAARVDLTAPLLDEDLDDVEADGFDFEPPYDPEDDDDD